MVEPDIPTIAELQRGYAARRWSPTEVVASTLARIEHANPHLNAFLTIAREPALEAARTADAMLMTGEPLPPLFGVPIAVKDAEMTAGLRTTFGSKAYAQHIPDASTINVERLVGAGAIVVGKTNTPEFTLLGETHNLLRADCCNPVDRSRTTGGSSGGSAAAVAAGLVPLATGTDTAGSITIPAAFCGVFGLKPSHRLIPVWPNWDDWPCLYDVGPITRSVADAALSLQVTAGADPRDPYARRAEMPDFEAALQAPWRKLRIAWAPTIAGLPVEPVCSDAVASLADAFARLGHEVAHAAPDVAPPGAIIEDIGLAEEFRARGHLLDRGELLYPDTLSMLDAGRALPAARYADALNGKQRIAHAFDLFFERFDILLAPASACPAFPLRRPPGTIDGQDVRSDWIGYTPFNMYANLAGGPVATLPTGSAGHLPIGVLAFGRIGADCLVLRVAEEARRAGCWIDLPPIGTLPAAAQA